MHFFRNTPDLSIKNGQLPFILCVFLSLSIVLCPSGRISPRGALIYGTILALLSVLLLASTVNVLAAALSLCGFVGYVGIYTVWLKRRTPQNIVIGGAAGAVPPLVGWAAATGHLSWTALLLFAIVFYWTPRATGIIGTLTFAYSSFMSRLSAQKCGGVQ